MEATKGRVKKNSAFCFYLSLLHLTTLYYSLQYLTLLIFQNDVLSDPGTADLRKAQMVINQQLAGF